MSDPRPAGPFSFFTATDGSAVPLYLIPFDKQGRCIGPKTLEHLKAQAATGRFTDIHIYSHGWNNVFKEAVEHYNEFFREYFELRGKAKLTGANYKPLLVGIIWPSTALVSSDDATPKFAATAPVEVRAEAMDNEMFAVKELADDLPDSDVPRLFELAEQDRPLSHDEAVEFARILLPIFQREATDQEGIPSAVTPEKLVKSWEQASAPPSPDEGKPAAIPDDDEPAAAPAPAVRTAGFLDFLNPKEIIRTATVYQMKDRAGTVGKNGVGPLLRDLLAATTARIHLTGHSYGCKVVLSALCLVDHPRKVSCVLLLEPAINAFCFAASIKEHGGKPGAFRPALERSERPVFATFSSNDAPLTKFFHLALRRDGDLGEVRPAAGPPSMFAALGGYGPGGMKDGESKTVAMIGAPAKYDVSDPRIRIYALDGSDHKINSHGDVRNEFTEWALINLVSGSELP